MTHPHFFYGLLWKLFGAHEALNCIVDVFVAAEDRVEIQTVHTHVLVEGPGILLVIEFAWIGRFFNNLEHHDAVVGGDRAYNIAFLGVGEVGEECRAVDGIADLAAETYVGDCVGGHVHQSCISGDVGSFAFIVAYEFLAFLLVAHFRCDAVVDVGIA